MFRVTTLLFLSAITGCVADDTQSAHILIAGDSTVQTYKGKKAEKQQGWGQTIGGFLTNKVTVENYAISGRSTKTFKNDWIALSKKIRKGSIVLIQFGHNDSHKSSRPEATDASTDYKENLIAYVNDAKKKGGIPILVTPPYRRSFDGDAKLIPYISSKAVGPSNLEPYALAMRDVAGQESVILIDLFARSGKLLQSLGDKASISLFCSSVDRAHFSPYGARVMAKLILLELSSTNSPLAKVIDKDALNDFQIRKK